MLSYEEIWFCLSMSYTLCLNLSLSVCMSVSLSEFRNFSFIEDSLFSVLLVVWIVLGGLRHWWVVMLDHRASLASVGLRCSRGSGALVGG